MMKYLLIIAVALCAGCQQDMDSMITEKHANGADKTRVTFLGDTTHLITLEKFYPSGKLFKKVDYQEDGKLPKREELLHENGEVKQAGEFKNNHRVGTWKAYFPTGQLQSMRNYNDSGKEEGIYQVYKLEGDYYYLYLQGFFSNGEKRGTWKFFNRDGDIIKTLNN